MNGTQAVINQQTSKLTKMNKTTTTNSPISQDSLRIYLFICLFVCFPLGYCLLYLPTE